MSLTPLPPPSPSAWDLIRELYLRLGQKSPRIFRYITNLGTLLSFVTFLPYILQMWFAPNPLPDYIQMFQNKTILIASLVAAGISKLTVQNTPVTVAPDAVVVKAEEDVLPFTTKAVAQDVAKAKGIEENK